MSRSNPEIKLESPCTRYFEWNGDEGGFKYFDKAKEQAEKGTGKIKVPLPFTFIVLDMLVTIGGFSDANQSGFWSNEIRKKDIKTGIFKVRNKHGLVCEGTYENIKGKESGMKYCESIYIAYLDENKKFQIGNIKMVGAGLNAWINFVSGEKDDKGKRISEPHNPEIGAIDVKSMLQGKKGKTIYQMPVFTTRDIKEETNNQMIEMDKVLQEYLKAYFAKNALEQVETEAVDPAVESPVEYVVPEKSAKEIIADKKASVPAVVDQHNDLPADFDEPF